MWDNILLLPLLLLPSLTTAARLDAVFSPFSQPFLEDQFLPDNATLPNLELVKRQSCSSTQNTCPQGYCCPKSSLCTTDQNGNIACCPNGSACTGTIRPVSSGTSTSFIAVGGTTTTSASTTTTNSAATGNAATTTSGNIVIIGASGATVTQSAASSSANGVKSYVSNPYYPYAYIPTTYTNAAACSTAYSTCHADFGSCTAFLAGSPGAHGVTVSVAGGGGTTVAAATPTVTMDAGQASSVCASLSSSACYGLVVEACGNYGTGGNNKNAAMARCTGVAYAAGVGAGVAAIGAMAL